MSITTTITDFQIPTAPTRAGDLGRVGRHLLPLLGPVLLPVAEDLIPGLGVAVAVAGLLRLRVST